jgi:recombination protein RecA
MSKKVVKKFDKKAALLESVDLIQKEFGKSSIMMLGSDKPIESLPRISSAFPSLDLILGGGYPKGRIIEVWGAESSGKTTVTLHAIAEVQKKDGVVLFMDAEHALDPIYASKLGVDVKKLWVSQPDAGEDVLNILEKIIEKGGIDLVVVDSVAALVPRAELEGDIGDAFMALQARMMSQALRKLTPKIANSNTCVIFINQVRGTMNTGNGPRATTSGGKALKFYASIRIETARIETLIKGKDAYGTKHRIKTVKNKTFPPFRECTLTNIFGYGFSKTHDIVEHAIEQGLVIKGGAWYSYSDKKVQGLGNFVDFLNNDELLLDEITKKVYDGLNKSKDD